MFWRKNSEQTQRSSTKNCAFSWFPFLKLILMHGDEQYKRAATFLTDKMPGRALAN
jgi:hypothetical protein